MPDLHQEDHFRSQGRTIICGIDEAGRGPLAGPVCAAAVILPAGFSLVGLDDSKKIKSKDREALFQAITTHSQIHWACATVEAGEIDKINILAATHKAMALATEKLLSICPQPISLCLIDGLPVPAARFPYPQHAIVKGDSISLSIAAASIIAKVSRDRLMLSYAVEFPHYGFERHMGYGTKQHLTALHFYGPCRIHRRSFQPVSQLTLPLG